MKTLRFLTIAAIAPFMVPQAVSAQDEPQTVQIGVTNFTPSGEGTEASPYVLENRNHLRSMRSLLKADETKYFILANDIDMRGIDWEPLNPDDPYNKRIVFDGKGHALKNLYCYNKKYASFFGVLYGECRNVRFINPVIYNEKTTLSHIGVIGGYIGTTGKPAVVEHVSIEGGTVYAYWTNNINIGGMCGNAKEATIKNCYVDAIIHTHYGQTNACVGGIAGDAKGSISNCFVKGEIQQTSNKDNRAGGIVGAIWSNSAQIDNCIAWLSKIQGKFTSNAICYGDPKPNVGTNYCYAGTVYDLTTDANYGCPDADKPTFKDSVHGTETTNACEAASTLGWDTTVWDLSGELPALRWE